MDIPDTPPRKKTPMKKLSLLLPLIALSALAAAPERTDLQIRRDDGHGPSEGTQEAACAARRQQARAAMAHARYLFLSGDPEGALAASSNLLSFAVGGEEDPVESRALNNIAWALHLLGRDAEALEPARRAVEVQLRASAASLDTLACVLDALGETDEAKDKLAVAFDRLGDEWHPHRAGRGKKAAARVHSPEYLEYERHLQFHLAQMYDRAGETALAKAILDNLRLAGFVPEEEEAAYDTLADRLGAAPLAPDARERAAVRRLAGLVEAVVTEHDCGEAAHGVRRDAFDATLARFDAIDATGAPADVRGALDALRNGYRDFFAVAKEFPADPEAAPVALKRRLGAAGIRLHAAGRDLLRAVRRHGVRSDALRDALTFFEED